MRAKSLRQLNRESEQLWASKYEKVPAKVGTIPMLIWINKEVAEGLMSHALTVGDRITFAETEWGNEKSGYLEEIRFSNDGNDVLTWLLICR